LTAKPYIPYTTPERGEDEHALLDILETDHWYTTAHRLRVVKLILDAGFRRTAVRKVTRAQLWMYFIETALLALCAYTIGYEEHPFIFGILCALVAGSAATFTSGLIINYAIKKGFKP